MNQAVLKQNIENHIELYMSLVKDMYEHPEIGNEEFRAMEKLSGALKDLGFAVEKGFVVPTGFIGKYDTKKPGPTIAFLCEYDALPEVGHGCGHNLIAGIGLAAGVAVKSIIDSLGGQVWVIGTPAEENFGGKVTMADAGIFQDVDAALMIHPSNTTGLGGKTNALYPLKFEFFGKNAHACHAQVGRSALDAAVLSFININLLRQFAEANTFIHGIIRDGGLAANVIPAYASMEYYFRGSTMKYVKELSDRALKCVEGACLATETTFKSSVYECPYVEHNVNYSLTEMLRDTYALAGVSDVEGVKETPAGSSDIGAVSFCCPTLHGYIKIADECVNGHSKEMAAATISEAGKDGLRKAALALALVGEKLLADASALQKVKDEFIASIK